MERLPIKNKEWHCLFIGNAGSWVHTKGSKDEVNNDPTINMKEYSPKMGGTTNSEKCSDCGLINQDRDRWRKFNQMSCKKNG